MFQPTAGENIEINGTVFRVASHPSAPSHPYGQEGRQAVVYKLQGNDRDWALKVFKPRYRKPSLVRLARRMAAYASVPGLEVCERAVVSTEENLELLRARPDLVYAALMPWMEGPTWMEVLLSGRPLTAEKCLETAGFFLKTMVALEENGLSHGDMSGANTIMRSMNGGGGISLVDVEQMYAPGFERPDTMTESSPGYGFPKSRGTLWGPLGDRYAGSIMLAEMLSLCDDRTIEASWGESFFAESEPGTETPRFTLMEEVLRTHWGTEMATIFRRNWFAGDPEECAPFAEWLIRLPDRPREEFSLTMTPIEEPSQAARRPPSGLPPAPDLEMILAKADAMREAGELKGAGELYSYILGIEELSPERRREAEVRLESLAGKPKNAGLGKVSGWELSDESQAQMNAIKMPGQVGAEDQQIAATEVEVPATLAPERAGIVAPQRATVPAPGAYATAATSLKKAQRKGRQRAWMIAVPVAVVLVAAIVVGLVFGLKKDTAKSVKVPEVVGMSEKDAESAIEKVGFVFASRYRTDDKAEKGKVLQQKPEKGTEVEKGSKVYVTIAVKGQVDIPNLVGQGQDQALAALQAASLNVSLTQEFSADQAQHGIIIRQDPAAGTRVDNGTSIALVVAVYQAPEPTTQPTQPTATTWVTCPTCGGSGQVPRTRAVSAEERCPVCGGDGVTSTGPCGNCGGDGYVTVSHEETYYVTCPTCGGRRQVQR